MLRNLEDMVIEIRKLSYCIDRCVLISFLQGVASKRVTIQGLMFHIEKIYSQHVVSDWLPNTAKCLLVKWDQACQEVVGLGIPRSSGSLKGAALTAFKEQARAEILWFKTFRTHSGTLWLNL